MLQGSEAPGTTTSRDITQQELQLAARNHGMPLEALGYDETPVGLHYLLIHYDIPAVDADGWRLVVDGHVERPLTLTLADLATRPQVTAPVTLECAGNGRALLSPRAISQPWLLEAVGTGTWTGVPLAAVLAEAGVRPGALEVVATGLDEGVEGGERQHYQRSLPLAEAQQPEVLLAHRLNRAPLPPQHGFPVRLLVPGWYGMASVKWLTRLEVVDEPFAGYQNAVAYRSRQDPEDPGIPLGRIAVRALMVPPGVPDFATRRRFVPAAGWELMGRAWSGRGPVTRVEVSDDAGAHWQAAEVAAPPAPYAWQAWRFAWRPAGPGDYVLCCRATDASGAVQPLEPAWNLGGYAGNAVQRVDVTVEPAGA
jgi:sulfane dehydrogenase subunit SoxC